MTDIFRVLTLKSWFLPVSLEALQSPPPSTGLTPVTPSFHICKVKQKLQWENPSPALPGCCSCTRHPNQTCPPLKCCGLHPIQQQELLPDAASGASHPAVPAAPGHATASPKSPRTGPSCVLTHASRTKQAPKSLQDQGLPSLWIIPTQFQVNYYSYTCITWL